MPYWGNKRECQKIIGKAPKNIIDDLISGKRKDGDEVEVVSVSIKTSIGYESFDRVHSDGTVICK
jgi:hypothetical protein